AVISFAGFGFPGFGLIISGLGVLILVLSIFQMVRIKRVFSIVLGIGGSEVTAYRSTNRDIVEKIIQALNQAIIERG
ncbi:MAG TPA: DUF6232 family protein, partial [Candidatus Acidoferrum sp.]|nr:DUF6232 family protein [Candidatus Acidoferrum sp.]